MVEDGMQEHLPLSGNIETRDVFRSLTQARYSDSELNTVRLFYRLTLMEFSEENLQWSHPPIQKIYSSHYKTTDLYPNTKFGTPTTV